MEDIKIIKLACSYVKHMSESKPYNIQSIANKKLFESVEEEILISFLQLPIKEFCEKFSADIVRDFTYKNDYFTPRRVYIINPLYYIYYTYIVFKISYIYLGELSDLNFSTENMDIFYSGNLNLNIDNRDIKKFSTFNYSYSKFQEKRTNYFGYSVLKIDIKDFFDSIKISSLIEKLKKIIKDEKTISDLNYFLDYCKIDRLPQFHYSIASSILSQFYLKEFDSNMDCFLKKNKLKLIRFVDDMYIIHTNGVFNEKKSNDILNQINYFLWRDSLVLNSSKTKLMSDKDFEYDYKLVQKKYMEDSGIAVEKLIEEESIKKITEKNFIKFIKELCKIEKEEGINLKKYKCLIDKYISIKGEDASKILKNITFSHKYKMIDEKYLIKIIENVEFIFFNPTEFTTIYIFICRYLNDKKVIDLNEAMDKLIKRLFSEDIFTLRDTIIASTYLIQSNFENLYLIDKINQVDTAYINYIEKYLLNYNVYRSN